MAIFRQLCEVLIFHHRKAKTISLNEIKSQMLVKQKNKISQRVNLKREIHHKTAQQFSRDQNLISHLIQFKVKNNSEALKQIKDHCKINKVQLKCISKKRYLLGMISNLVRVRQIQTRNRCNRTSKLAIITDLIILNSRKPSQASSKIIRFKQKLSQNMKFYWIRALVGLKRRCLKKYKILRIKRK